MKNLISSYLLLVLFASLLPAQDSQAAKKRVRLLFNSDGIRFECELIDDKPTRCQFSGQDLILEENRKGDLIARDAEGNRVVQILCDYVVPTAVETGELKLGITATQPNEVLCKQLCIMADHSMLITGVNAGSLAERSGLEVHDILIGLDDAVSASEKELARKLKSLKPEGALRLWVLRDGKRRYLQVTPKAQDWVTPARSVPILSDLPIIAQLFTTKEADARDRDLLISLDDVTVQPNGGETSPATSGRERDPRLAHRIDDLAERLDRLEVLMKKLLQSTNQR